MCAVYRGPVCKLCRRERRKLFLKGQRCFTAKCSVDKRTYPPGHHGQRRYSESGYGLQLREKQKVKRTLFIKEKQFRRFFKIAEKEEGPTGQNLLVKLECRLDNIIRRLGFAQSILQARQLILHRHVKVNSRICNIPSYIVKEGDKIEIRSKSKNLDVVKKSIEETQAQEKPEWLDIDTSSLKGKIKRLPTRDEISLADGDIKENLIVELYSK